MAYVASFEIQFSRKYITGININTHTPSPFEFSGELRSMSGVYRRMGKGLMVLLSWKQISS